MKNPKTTKSELPPIDLKEDIGRYEAFNEQKEIKFDNCKHKDVKHVGNQLLCGCGASWSGERLSELFDFLTKRK